MIAETKRPGDLAMARLSEHLLYLADRLIKVAGALPDGEPWVEVSAVAIELTRLGRLFSAAQGDGTSEAT